MILTHTEGTKLTLTVLEKKSLLSYQGSHGAKPFTAVFFVGLVISKANIVHKITNLQLFIAVSEALLFVGSIANMCRRFDFVFVIVVHSAETYLEWK